MNIKLKSLALVLVVLVQGCLPPIKHNLMAPKDGVYLTSPTNPILKKNIALNTVIVKDDAMGSVTVANLQAALVDALTKAQYLDPNSNGKYLLDATLLQVERPFMGFNLNAKVTIRYSILRRSDLVSVLDETVTIAHEVAFAEEPDADRRMTLAIAAGISGNITHFLRILSARKF